MTQDQYQTLVAEVNRLRGQVNLFDIEEISQQALDDLKHQITIFEKNHPELISPASSNYTIQGGVLKGFKKASHNKRMLSLVDIFNFEELQDWEKRYYKHGQNEGIINQEQNPKTCYIIEPKIDGLALSLIYDNGELIQAITRGDGYIGEDVTLNAKMIANIPKSIADKQKLEVRGEVFLTKSDFEDLNQAIIAGLYTGKGSKIGKEAIFANPRNAASGSLRQLDSNIVKQRKLSFIAYYFDYL
jgi:DNA ligase (NAD+)